MFDVILYVIIFILVGSAVYLLTAGIFAGIKRPPRLRLSKDARYPSQFERFKKQSLPKILKPFEPLARPFSNFAYFKNLQMQTEVLRVRLDITMLVLQKIFLGIAFGLLVQLLFFSPLNALVAALLGFFLPDFIIMSRIRAKRRAILSVFPETVDLLDMCINAGADFLSSIKLIVEKSTYNAFIEQLEIVLNETRIGKSRSDALKDMAKRLKIVDINSFVRTVVQSERMGTSIEEAFKTLSEDTRDRRFQAGERFAIKASLKILFPLIFCILPAIMIVVAGPIIIRFTQGGLFPTGTF
jgi:pilus assembly protein TadC